MPNEWISVKEKVPENREWVLIIGEFTEGGFCVPHIAEFDSGVWRVDCFVGDDYEKEIGVKVTHWMPLPEPPEELQNPVITSKTMGDTCTELREKLSAPEYVERGELLRQMRNSKVDKPSYGDWDMAHDCCIDITECISAAEVVEIKHGKWLYVSGVGRYAEYECSECKAHVCFDEKIDGTIPVYNGCPHCLAKMDGKDKNNAVHRQ